MVNSNEFDNLNQPEQVETTNENQTTLDGVNLPTEAAPQEETETKNETEPSAEEVGE